MSRYRVTGYDESGAELFSLSVEDAPNEDVATLMAMAQLRRTPDGTEKANKAERVIPVLEWR